MTEMNLKVLELINNNKSIKEIASILNLSEKQVYIRIKQLINYGYNLIPSYCYDSDIFYNLSKKPDSIISGRTNINMHKKDNQFRCLVRSGTL